MKMLLIDVYNNEVKMVNADGLEDYYKYIGCRCIDIVRRVIGDTTVEIVCDDEGTFVENPKISAIDIAGTPCLVGNLLIASGRVIDGELTELKDEEIEEIMQNVDTITTSKYKEPYRVLFEVH